MFKTEYKIWKDLVAAVKDGLAYNEITGWDVFQANQPSKSTLNKPTIWIERVSSKRYGWQSATPTMTLSGLNEKQIYYQEVIYQITAMKKRSLTMDETTETSGDVLNHLATYFVSRAGTDKLSENDYSCLRVTEVREPPFTTDSDLYEKTPSFDLTICHQQVEDRPVHHVDGFTLTTEKI